MPHTSATQCLAVVLQPEARTDTPVDNGLHVFKDFVSANRAAAATFNAALSQALAGVEYVGWMKPSTLLVSGPELNIDYLRTAWTKRSVNPPKGYAIKSLGELSGLEMHDVPQTCFVSLPATICQAIAALNQMGRPATMGSIADLIRVQYPGMQQPKQLFTSAMASLMRDNKVYRLGAVYYLTNPWIYQSQPPGPYSGAPTTTYSGYQAYPGDNVASWPSQETVYKKKPDRTRDMCSQECQTGASVVNGPAVHDIDERKPKSKSRRHCKLQSRSADRLAPAPKEKTEVVETVMEKKDRRSSIFGKLFQRRSRSKNAPDSSEPCCVGEAAPAKQKPPVVHATFAAQFPPPEWMPQPALAQQPVIGQAQRDYCLPNWLHPRQPEVPHPYHAYSPHGPGVVDRSIWIDAAPSSREDLLATRPGPRRPYQLTSVRPNADYTRKKHRTRLSKYLSSSSEALRTIDLFPPVQGKPKRRANRGMDRFELSETMERSLDETPSFATPTRSPPLGRSVPTSQEATPTATEVLLPHLLRAAPSEVQRTSTPTQELDVSLDSVKARSPGTAVIVEEQRARDSALSVSPPISATDSNKYSSWSGSEGAKSSSDPPKLSLVDMDPSKINVFERSVDSVSADSLDHTYVNVKQKDSGDHTYINVQQPALSSFRPAQCIEEQSTRFENITNVSFDLDTSQQPQAQSVAAQPVTLPNPPLRRQCVSAL